MSASSSSHVYGIGLITVLIGASVGIVFYQMFYIPESNAKPQVDEHILHPVKERNEIDMIPGSAKQDQQDNFVPKRVNIQLGIDNHVFWHNKDDTPHTITPDTPYEDDYSGKFASPGVVKPGQEYDFLFTHDGLVPYHCEPHPWMKGTLEITKQRF